MNEIKIPFPDASMFDDPSNHTEHDRYYKKKADRDLYCELDFFAKVEANLLEENANVFLKIGEVLKEIQEAESEHKKRSRVHDWNNIAMILSGRLQMLEDVDFNGTFSDLKNKTELKKSYRMIIRALANYYRDIS